MLKPKARLLIDLVIISMFLPLALPLFILFGDYINNNANLLSIILLSIIEFCGAGLGAFVIIFIRNESFLEYGITKKNLKKSLGLGILFISIMVLLKSIDAGEFLYFPMRNHTAMKYSLQQFFPFNYLGIIITLSIWGIVEGIYFVVIIKKIEDLFTNKTKLQFFMAPVIFFIYDFLIHYIVRVFVEQRTYNFSVMDVLLSLILSYAIFIPRKLTGNSWGSMIYQTIQNGLGKM